MDLLCIILQSKPSSLPAWCKKRQNNDLDLLVDLTVLAEALHLAKASSATVEYVVIIMMAGHKQIGNLIAMCVQYCSYNQPRKTELMDVDGCCSFVACTGNHCMPISRAN